jgi:anti-sigma factor RsiW
MTNRISEADLHAYIDGELSAARAAEVEQHLAAHPELAVRLAADLRHKHAIRQFAHGLELPPPTQAARRLQGRLGRRLLLGRILGIAPRVALVVLSIGVGWGAHTLYQAQRDNIPVFADEAAEAHATYSSALLTTAGDDPGAIAGLLQSIHESAAIADQDEASLKLIGAHLVSSDEGPAVLLLYEDPTGQRVSLVVSREDTIQDIALSLAERDGYTLAYWQDDWTAFTLTGGLKADEAVLLAERIRSDVLAHDDLL